MVGMDAPHMSSVIPIISSCTPMVRYRGLWLEIVWYLVIVSIRGAGDKMGYVHGGEEEAEADAEEVDAEDNDIAESGAGGVEVPGEGEEEEGAEKVRIDVDWAWLCELMIRCGGEGLVPVSL